MSGILRRKVVSQLSSMPDEFLGLRGAMPAGLEAGETLSAAQGWSAEVCPTDLPACMHE
jgi:hypothetical protein